MPTRLFALRNVPDDEAEEIRDLLSEHHIEFYETSAGNWGVSAPGLWLPNEDQLKQAKALIDEYQVQRGEQQRALYQQLKHEGRQTTFWLMLWQEPLKVIAYIAIVLVILYFSTKPFLSLGTP
jgi:Family of unknown function (DUF6164)